MKIKEYLSKLNTLVLENPHLLVNDVELYYSIDDEGDRLKPVHFDPSVAKTTIEKGEIIVNIIEENDTEANSIIIN